MSRRRSAAPPPAAEPDLLPFTPKVRAMIARRLDALLEQGNEAEVLDALRDLARRTGGVGRIAERTGLNRTFLYRMLSPAGNPEMRTIAAVLRALGMRFGIRAQTRRPRGAAGRRAGRSR